VTPPATIAVRPIGVVRSRFTTPAGMPVQGTAAAAETGEAEVFAEFAPALRDVEGFGYLIFLTHMHLATEKLEVVPFLDTMSHGVFATRAPARPNRIALSVVKLERVEGRILHFSGNDMVDGTPLLDIKPYVPAFDVRATDRIGWFRDKLAALEQVRADDRMR
jgi:tRNA-Thr(GGU) m(6)t(6)A37 methyltransferase TsaA